MEIIIRAATLADQAKIRPLQEEIAQLHYAGRPDLFRLEPRYYTDQAFWEKLEDPKQWIYVAEGENGQVVGYAFACVLQYRAHSTYRDFDSFYIDDICVLKAFRRQGIGKRLFEACVAQARAEKCHNVDLGVWAFNREAIAFYESCGLRERMRRMELRLD